jgi:hypothetical protein
MNSPYELILIRVERKVRIPPIARVAVKQLKRKAQIDHLLATREADTENFCSYVTTKKAQRDLGAYLESMKKKK